MTNKLKTALIKYCN